MAVLLGRVQFISSGWSGGPGLSQLHFLGADGMTWGNADTAAALSAAQQFFGSMTNIYASAWKGTVQSTVQVIQADTGQITDEMTGPTQVDLKGPAGQNFGPVAVGAITSWKTSTLVGRRRLRGRTFLSPLATSAYGPDGLLTSTAQSAIQAGANALVAHSDVDLVVWHRPIPFRTGNNGSFGVVKAASVPVQGAILRSRRD